MNSSSMVLKKSATWSLKYLVALILLTVPLKAFSNNEKNQIIVDLGTSEQPCESLRNGFQQYFISAISSGQKKKSLRIVGQATVYIDDLIDLGEYQLCAGLGEGLFGSNVISGEDRKLLEGWQDRGKVKLTAPISFDNVVVTFDSKGQTTPVVLFQLGAFYNFGWSDSSLGSKFGTISVGGHFKGDLTLSLKKNQSKSWPTGSIPGLPFKKGNISNTSTIGWFETGIHRIDMTRFSLSIEGEKKDFDDIGLLHQHSWGVRRGPIRIENLGVGLLFYGNSAGSISNSYIYSNGFGLVLGDFNIGGDVAPSSNCIIGLKAQNKERHCQSRDQPVLDLSINDSVIEGNRYGNVVINDASRIDFNSVHIEMSLLKYQKGHNMLIGGGRCVNANRVGSCGSDADCDKGHCQYPKRTIIRGIRFIGGVISGDRFSNMWDGTVIGSNAKQGKYDMAQIYFENIIHNSDLNPHSQLGNRCVVPGVLCGIVSYRKGATIKLDFSRAVYKKGATLIHRVKD